MTLRLFNLFLFSCITTLLAAQETTPRIDITRYGFNISVSDRNDSIRGEATIKLSALQAARFITLDLMNVRPDGKGMTVSSVSSKATQLKYSHVNNKLQINLPSVLRAGDSIECTIRYGGIPADGLIISKNKYQRRTFFADNWPNRAHHWIPCKDDPADKAPVDFALTAPEHYQAIANGIQVEESGLGSGMKLTRYREEVPLPTKVMVIGLADFSQQLLSETRGVPVSAWVYAEDHALAKQAYGSSSAALEFLSTHVGPYPYRKLANVQSKTMFGGLENANTIFYYENSVSANANNEALVMHETSHQWFGNSATETAFAHVWLSEGFATYMTHLFIEEKYGADSLRKEMAADRLKVIEWSSKQPALRSIVDSSTTNYMDLLNPNSYEKASWVLHMLRLKVGDSAFWKGVRTYYSTYAGKNASTNNFRQMVEAASGSNLQSFFQQWLFTPGHPVLDIQTEYKDKTYQVTITQKQPTVFEFTLPLNILTSEGAITKSTSISQRVTSFKIPFDEKPMKLVVDPQSTVLLESRITNH